MTKLVLPITAILLFAGCSSKSGYQLFQTDSDIDKENSTREYSARSIEYHILPQDRLEVVLYKDPNQKSMISQQGLGQSLNKNGVLVNKEGFVTLPLIGKVKVAGLSQTAAADKITSRLKKYINSPSVYLEVLNKRIIVIGEVKKPGIVTIDKEKMTLFEALAFAGDITDSAVRDNILILSADKNGKLNMRHVDLTDFDTMAYNQLMLRPNDIVYVRPNSWKAFRVASDDYTSIFTTISKILSPFVSVKYLQE